MKRFLLYIWQLPQNLVGLFVRLIFSPRGSFPFPDCVFYEWERSDAISLGNYIFVPEDAPFETVWHEFGHNRQSRMLGWLYLPIIGIPSIIWAGCFKKYRRKHGVNYYSLYTEKWADKLGGVNRE